MSSLGARPDALGWLERPDLLFVGSILRRDLRALAFTMLGSTIAAMVAVFQFAVFTSFLQAAAVIPRLVSADAWITAPGVPAFDFPYAIAEDYAGLLARCFPGASFERVAFGFAQWTSPIGTRGNVGVVGIHRSDLPSRTFVVDRSDKVRLDLTSHSGAEIGGVSMSLHGLEDRVPTFLGVPYVIMSFRDAAKSLGLPADRVSFLAVRQPREGARSTLAGLNCAEHHFPEVSVQSGGQFSLRSAVYWMLKTGAGAAVLLGSALATLLYVILLTNGVGRFLQRRHKDLITILGFGGDPSVVAFILLYIALILALGSMLLAALLLPAVDVLSEPLIPWVEIDGTDLSFALVVGVVGSATAFGFGLANVKALEEIDVFRT